ncbi:MAG: molybdate metabolism transcriptional regulator [Polynucleobacter sp. 24-46-87]|uniref:helix-turn-helix transcriptional regulator n=1 Tax=Polynucleobacter sp. 35-46-11 TaxID=1970425 RepID=UPI000BD33D54|nr:substrate-binding domain-containing protein [Polynucleobacter sp. 35-46-11]OYY17047.1 MAG: molybdate metabolism transcriptional regulator [Polynucleobacter sp. 35-46-11]OZA05299.1 MAG: molybdate metabolism transcriptional regulator [Polynucleobacter sp. 24-46-87]
MRIQIRPTLVFGSKNAKDPAIVDLVWLTALLKDIEHGKTLMSACKKMGLSYRNVWQKLNDVEQALGFKLIDRVRGHGSQLSEYARYLIQFTEDFDQKTMRLGQSSLSHLEEGFSQFRVKDKKQLRFASSSDPIIQKAVFEIGGFELITAGSGEALERLLNYEVDIAGFHVSDPQSSQIISKRLQKEGMQIFPVMKRVQGLLVAKGNPLNIISIKDLLRPKIRFINRQKGSGTRLLLDTILAKEGMVARSIKGYENEEFTHSAIATAILARKADVGMGVKSVALENGLDFIQLKDEIFFLAMNEELSLNADLAKLIRKIRVLSGASPGYKSIGLKKQIAGWL